MKKDITLKEAVYNYVLEGILNNEFRPEQIINEKELIQRCGYSKTPVREGLIMLCNDKILRSIPRYGYEIVRLTREDVENMLCLRYLLEGGSLLATFDRFTPTHLDQLREINEECTQYRTDLWKHWESNTRFHLALLSPSKNDCALEMLRDLMGRLKRAYSQFFWDRLDTIDLSEDTYLHQFIIEALANRNRSLVLKLLQEDLQRFGDFQCTFPPYFV